MDNHAGVGHHGINWSEVTALATGALVLVTLGLVVAAGLAAWLAKRDIDVHLRTSAEDLRATRAATKAAQVTAQRQLRASYRPLLIELPPSGPIDENEPMFEGDRVLLRFPGGHYGSVEQRQVYVAFSAGRINVSVLLRNVGKGLAVIHPMQVQLLGPRMLQQLAGEWLTVVERPRVPPNETTRILHAPTISQTEMADYPWLLILRVPYWDFAEEEGWVALIYLEQAYQRNPWLLREIRHEALEPPA